MKTILYYSLLLFGLLFGFSCQNNQPTEEYPKENITESTTENKEQTAEENSIEEEIEKETEEFVNPFDGKARGLTKENVWEQLTTYKNIEDFFKKKPTELKSGELLTLIGVMGAEHLNVFTKEEVINGIFSAARAYDGDAYAKVDLGKFYLIKIGYSSNMGGGEELMVWDKKNMLRVSSLRLSSSASTQYYQYDSETKILGENHFEEIEKTELYSDNSKEEKKTRFDFDPETGQFSKVE